jgi:hypothetical protein
VKATDTQQRVTLGPAQHAAVPAEQIWLSTGPLTRSSSHQALPTAGFAIIPPAASLLSREARRRLALGAAVLCNVAHSRPAGPFGLLCRRQRVNRARLFCTSLNGRRCPCNLYRGIGTDRYEVHH